MRRHLLGLRPALAAAAEGAAAEASSSGRHHFGGSMARWYAAQASSAPQPLAAAAAAAAGGTPRAAPGALRRLRALLRDYKQLSKARLSALVVSTAAAGYAAGSQEAIDWAGMGWTVAGTALAASSANALNQIYEVANDARMKRTALRPLPSGRMSRPHALAFALLAGGGGVWLLADKTNAIAAALGAGNILLYAGVYTPLKQLSVVNTWVGAVVGAIPPLMGWAAAAGSLDAGSALLAAGLYFWQLPHFMSLAWLCRADYAAGGYRMLSLVDPTGKRVAACALRNAAYLFPLGTLATWLGVTTPYFAYESAFITAGMLLTAAKFYSAPSNANARLLFRASLLHLPLFMAAFLVHRRPNTEGDKRGLLAHNVRLLGFGAPLEAGQERGAGGGGAGAWRGGEGESGFGRAMGRVSLPPLPFLPVVPQLVACPSKAICQQEGPSDQAPQRPPNAPPTAAAGGGAPAPAAATR
jgi:protoheme IX farnesyltransferase